MEGKETLKGRSRIVRSDVAEGIECFPGDLDGIGRRRRVSFDEGDVQQLQAD